MTDRLARTCAPALPRGRRGAACRAQRNLDRPESRKPGQIGPATGWLGRARRIWSTRTSAPSTVIYSSRSCSSTRPPATLPPQARPRQRPFGIGERFGDRDLFALAIFRRGLHAHQGRKGSRGPRAVGRGHGRRYAGRLLPIVTGIVYCGVILACQEVYEVRRARVDEGALGLVGPAAGDGRVHRSLPRSPRRDSAARRRLADALEQARRAGERFLETKNPAAGLARYRQGELLRPRRVRGRGSGVQAGEHARLGAAARARAVAARAGAPRARRRRRSAARKRRYGLLDRLRLLPAYIEIMLAVGRSRPRDVRVTSSKSSPAATRAGCWRRWSRMPRARSSSWAARCRLPSCRFAGR